MSKMIPLLILTLCTVASSQQENSKLNLAKIEDLLRDSRIPTAVIDRQIQIHGVDFSASDEVHQELNKLKVQPTTWAMIVKYAVPPEPAKWEKLRRSPPNVRHIAVAGGTLLSTNSTNQVSQSIDQGEQWSSIKVTDASVRIEFVAPCGAFWVAGGRSGRKDPSLFVSNDSKTWSAAGKYAEDVTALVCEGDTITVGTATGIMSSPDRGQNWRTSFGRFDAHALGISDGVLDSLGSADLFDFRWAYCYQPKGSEWICEKVPYSDMISVARMNDVVCIGSESIAEVLVSFNLGKSWAHSRLPSNRTNDAVHSLLPLGKHIVASTGSEVFLGDENCEHWSPIGNNAPQRVFSLGSDGRFLYAGAYDGAYRFPISAIPSNKK